MKGKTRKYLLRGIAFILLVCLLPMKKVEAANSKYITMEKYIKLLVQALGENTSDYMEVALDKGILLKEKEFKDYSKGLTRVQCALLTERTNELLHGVDYDIETCKKVKKLKRISDLSKINEKYHDAIFKVFTTGIMVGSSDGKFTHTRKFNGNRKMTVSGAKDVIKRMKNKKERLPMTADGQLIRTTNLPVNAEEYDYILASFPNSYYDTKFRYEYGTSNVDKIKSGSAIAPVNIKNDEFRSWGYVGTVEETRTMINTHSQDWEDKIAKHIELLFNVNYKTVDKTWAKKIANTYYIKDDEEYQKRYNHIKAYIREMKKNHVVCETSQIALDKSSLYYASGYKMRVYVKYRMKADHMSNTSVLLYDWSGNSTFTQTKKWKWKECYFDISIGAKDGSHGGDYGIVNMYLTDCLNERKTKILKPVYDKKTGLYSFK